ncbi:MAG TPA: phosphatase PAP2 family protein [Burkholderiaceae bacterium]
MRTRSFVQLLALLLAAAALLIAVGRYTDLDLLLADRMFDPITNSFPLREHWFVADVMHHFMKALMLGIGLVPVMVLLVDLARRRTLLRMQDRRRWLAVTVASMTIPAIISASKALSIHHCPWSLTRYGGFAPYLRIFDRLPAGVTAGHCFPAGHASGGLWLAAACVFWLPHAPRKAAAMFSLLLLPGLALGWAQQLRGAHFMTHTLWSVWIAAAVTLLLAYAMERVAPARSAARSSAPDS